MQFYSSYPRVIGSITPVASLILGIEYNFNSLQLSDDLSDKLTDDYAFF